MAEFVKQTSKARISSTFKFPLLQRAFLLLPFLFFFTVISSHALDVKLQWQESGETDLAGYRIYYDTNPGAPYDPDSADYADEYSVDGGTTWNPVSGAPPIEVGNNVIEIMLRGLTDTKIYFFALTAYRDGVPESDYSEERSTFQITSPSVGFYVNLGSYTAYSVEGMAATKPEDIIVKSGSTQIGGPFSTDATGQWSGFCSFSSTSQGPVSLTAQSQTDGFTSFAVSGIYDRTSPSSNASSASSASEYILVTWAASDQISGVGSTYLWHKPPGATQLTNTWRTQPGTSGTFYYFPGYGEGTYYFATRAVDLAGNWEDEPNGDGDTSINYIASINTDPTGKEGGGGGCFVDTAAHP